ncbi:MAG: hypothetical protein RugAbin2_02421 [Rugosibacter sp.]|nr:hypothetical protein [Rugosibacter sp.]
MSTGHERFINSAVMLAIKRESMVKASDAWGKLPVGYRRMLCKQAGVDVDLAEGEIGAISKVQLQKLWDANKAIGRLAEAAKMPLLKAAINAPGLQSERFRL